MVSKSLKRIWALPHGSGISAAGWGPTVLFLGFISLPFAAVLIRGLGNENFWEALTGQMFLDALRLSLFTSLITVLVVVIVGTPVAYALARSDFRGKVVIDSLIELPIVLPPVVAGLGMLMAFGRNGLLGDALEIVGVAIPFTLAAVVLAQLFVSAPFYIRAAKIGFESVPRGLEDMAKTLGATPAQTFRRVTLPLTSRALIAGLVLCWARAVSEFGATIMFAGNIPGRTQTMSLAILTAFESSLTTALALASALCAISLGVLLTIRLAFPQGGRR